MIIGLTGRIAAGKGEIVKFLEGQGFTYTTISQIIRDEAAKLGIAITRKDLQDLGNEIRKKGGPSAWIKRLIENIEETEDYIVDGIRNPGEVEELRNLKNFHLISIDAPQKTRFERVISRNKDSDPNHWEGFIEIDERDFGEEDPLGQQVGKCIGLADFYVFNDNNLENLNNKILEIWEEIREII